MDKTRNLDTRNLFKLFINLRQMQIPVLLLLLTMRLLLASRRLLRRILE